MYVINELLKRAGGGEHNYTWVFGMSKISAATADSSEESGYRTVSPQLELTTSEWDIKFFRYRGWGGRGGYPFRKMRKSQEQYPFYNQILHNFHVHFFYYDRY